MTELEASGVGGGEPPPPYMIFVVVFLFFLTGLFGFLVCHLLKKKGYRCRTGDLEDDTAEEEKLAGGADDEEDDNQDTVEQILKCIIENEANMEAFNEMLGNRNVCVRHDPRLRKESIGGAPPHHHTVHSGVDHTACHLCAQGRSKKGRRPSRTPRSKQKPGEQTVFSVGRFRVIHTDKKPQGGPNPLAISGEQLNQSEDSEDRKEGGYNLRSMFKDVRPPSEGTNGVAGNAGKRRKSLIFFGLRRGSDPAAFVTRLEARSASPAPPASPSSTSGPAKEQEVEGAAIPKTEKKRAGILKTSKPSTFPPGDLQGSTLPSPPDQPSKDGLNASSPSAAQASSISSVSIVKPSSDGNRQFSVVTMVEEGESEPEPGPGSAVVIRGPEDLVPGVGQPDSQSKESPGLEPQPTLIQERDDMVEMEDIRDCKVTQDQQQKA